MKFLLRRKNETLKRAPRRSYNPTHMRLVSRRERCFTLLALALALSACTNGYKQCASMAPSDLVNKAALVRLDVYGAGAACNGATLAANPPAPSQTSIVGPGEAIKIKVPAGHHVLLLTAYADAAGTELLGSACTETDLSANEPACFNLVLLEPPDGGTGGNGPACDHTATDNCPVGSWCSPDDHCVAGCRNNTDCAGTPASPLCLAAEHRCVACISGSDCGAGKRCSPAGACVEGCDIAAGSMCPSPLMCCSQLCIDTGGGDILNCGSCGRACANGSDKGVAAASCSGSLCKPSCLDGFADCKNPSAPDADDGCETNTHDVNHCGNCTTVCSLPHATPQCPGGSCEIASCANKFTDCDGKPANGCECADIGDVNHGCCPAGGCETLHLDGFGHSYIDCLPKGTRTAEAATNAARSFNTANSNIVDRNCGTPGNQQMKCNLSSTVCACFTFIDTAGGTYVGHARRTFNNGSNPPPCSCPLGTLGTDEVLWDP
jgi:hypothetical protein